MFIRNGIRSNLRERGRTTLFMLLIIVLTVTMILALDVLLYCEGALDVCDESYRSIALIEYKGAEYPNEDEPDDAARAAAVALTDEMVLSVPGVTAWTRGNTAFAYADGYERRYGALPYGNRGVIVVSRISDPVYQWTEFDEEGSPILTDYSVIYYTGLFQSALYSRTIDEGILIDIHAGESGFVPEKGKSYVMNGSFVDTSGTGKQIGAYPMNGLKIFRVEAFTEAPDLPYAEYTEEERIPEIFYREAERYRDMNAYVRIVPCRDADDVYAFQQGILQLTEGRMPDPGDPGSCVVSADLAQALDLSPGDSFVMNELRGTAADRYDFSATGNTATYTVSGISDTTSDYVGTVWVIADDADTPLFGYLLGTVSLRNADAPEAVESLQMLAPERVHVTLLDQGYGNAVQPFLEARKTAVNALIICSAGVAAVLLLFAFLYVGRQSDTVKIMVSLGTPARKIALWFLSGALFICGVATLLGTGLGIVLRPYILRKVAEKSEALRTGEGFLWYSENSLGIVKRVSFDPKVPLWPNLLVMPGIVLLALMFCLLFLRLARRGVTRRRGKSRVYVPHGKTSVRSRGGLRYAILSIRRGGLKSLAVPLVSCFLTVAVLVLSSVFQSWQNELDDATENASIDGMVVSLDGRNYAGLSISIYPVRTLLGIEGIDKVSVSYGYPYWLPEEVPNFSNNEFGRARRLGWIDSQPEIVALNALDAAKEFYYGDPAVTWLEGWDESVLAETDMIPMMLRRHGILDEQIIPAVLSKDFLEEHGMVLGDTLSCMTKYEYDYGYGVDLREIPLTLQAVGSYIRTEGKSHIYVPLSFHIPGSVLKGNDVDVDFTKSQTDRMVQTLSFRTCRFRLSSAGVLDTVRERLRTQGFSAVGHISGERTTLVLQDSAFLKLRENMERNIAMGRVMSTVIMLMVILLGFIISWLMIYSRRQEFALMRGLGAKKRVVFASFFLEQAILSLLGCLAGCLTLFRLYAGGVTQPLAAASFLICYFAGTAVSVLIIGKTNLMELLTVRE